jgi:hypothetical protein
MVQNNHNISHRGQRFLQLLNTQTQIISYLLPHITHLVLALIHIQHTRIRPKFHPHILIQIHLQLLCQKLKRIREHIQVRSSRTINHPRNPFQPNPSINHLNRQLLKSPIMKCLILHEHNITNLHPTYKILDRRTQISTASPHILHECYLIRTDA